MVDLQSHPDMTKRCMTWTIIVNGALEMNRSGEYPRNRPNSTCSVHSCTDDASARTEASLLLIFPVFSRCWNTLPQTILLI